MKPPLKRSFVDVVFLVGLFDDFPRPRVQSVAGLIEGIDRVARHLSNWLLKQAPMQGGQSSVKAVLESWISDWRSRLINVPVVAHDVALNDSRLEASLLALKQRVLQTGAAGGVAADVQQFVDLFLGRLEHFAQYAMSVHEAMDARLCAEMQAAVIKIFAASAGSAMGFAYVQFKDGQDNESSLVRAIFAEWKAGI